MAYTFTEYHIFSDLTVSEHITVVVGFSNFANPDVYTTFSFGELDKGGLTYQGISYATGHEMLGYANNTNSGQTGTGASWSFTSAYTRWGFQGAVGESGFITTNNHSFLTQSTLAPHPNGSAGWPSWDTVHQNGLFVWNKAGIGNTIETRLNYFGTPSHARGIISEVIFTNAPSQTGTVSMMPQPFIMINGTGASSFVMYLGVYPNSRLCSMEGVIPGQEITYGAETWKVFPLLRQTPWTSIQQSGVVSSGEAGIAIKKVV
tara:strand:- start:326 stop:1108 length:783 start_codon:yes stop_codon:yes gene_type:complete